MRTNVYVDGFNLYYGCLRGTPYKWLDLGKLCAELFPKNKIERIRYFTARVSGRGGDQKQPQRQDAYLRAIQTDSRVSVHYGHFLTHRVPMAKVSGGTALVYKTEEKGSDVNIATYLLMDRVKGDCDVAVVITNDSDLAEPIRLARSELGLVVGVANPHRTRSLQLESDFFRWIRKKHLKVSQFANPVLDGAGKEIFKPTEW